MHFFSEKKNISTYFTNSSLTIIIILNSKVHHVYKKLTVSFNYLQLITQK